MIYDKEKFDRAAVIEVCDTCDCNIDKNTIADYFLLLAFDNRTDLNPEHIWLIKGSELNEKYTATIFETNLIKWNKYSLDNKLNQIKIEINKIKGDNKNG